MADDVEARVRVAEEELNLLKNQVQQTLLDVREHILDLVEPGSGIPRGDRPAESRPDGPDAAATIAPAPQQSAVPAGPTPDLGGGAGLGSMPGLDLGNDSGLGDMPGLDFGGDMSLGGMPDMDFGAGPGDDGAPGLELDPGDPGALEGLDGLPPMEDGLGFEDAPYDAEPDFEDAPYDDQDEYIDDGAYAPADDLPRPGAAQPEPAAAAEPEEEPGVVAQPAPAAPAMPVADMDLVTLVGVVRWVDQAVQRLGQRRVDALLDVWQMTGRVSVPVKEMIQRLCALTNEDADERVPLRDLVAMMIQMEAVLDTGESSNSRLLALLFDDPGDPLAGLGALAPR